MARRFLILLMIGFCLRPTPAHAESVEPLETLVRRSSLIVQCRTEKVGERVLHKVVDVLAGTYSNRALVTPAPPNYLALGGDPEGKEMVLIFTAANQPPGKISRPDMRLPVRDGRLEYPGGSELDPPRRFTLAEFKEEVRRLARLPAIAAPKAPERLEDLVAGSPLIIHTRTERVGERVYYRILSTLKGDADPMLFARPAPAGYLDLGANSEGAEQVLFFFRANPNAKINRFDAFAGIRNGMAYYRGMGTERGAFIRQIRTLAKP